LFEVAEPGERPVEMHDAEGVATALRAPGTPADSATLHAEV
jgi:hypothetical protein